jgi:tripeptide aminopeptidase
MGEPMTETNPAALPEVATELTAIAQREPQTLAQQIALSEIPAPSFAEGPRAQEFARLLAAAGVHDIEIDASHNVIGRLGPADTKLLLTGHLDTVFDQDTDVRVTTDEAGVLHGAGICDDARGLAAVLSAAKSLAALEDGLETGILIGANVLEEGKGNLGGITGLLDTLAGRFEAFITVDGANPERIVTIGPACHSFLVTFTGPGGHAYGDAGRVSAVHAAGRATVAVADLEVAAVPKTIVNVGAIRGGVTETSIAYQCTVEIDMRSDEQPVLDDLVARVRQAIEAAVAVENDRADTSAGEITYEIATTCDIPGGTLPEDAELGRAALAGYGAVGLEPYLGAAATTDANVPLSRGIPALCVGGGGAAGNNHSTNEYFDPTDSHLGPQGILLTALSFAGYRAATV